MHSSTSNRICLRKRGGSLTLWLDLSIVVSDICDWVPRHSYARAVLNRNVLCNKPRIGTQQETKQEVLFRSNQDQLSSNLCVGVCVGGVSAPLNKYENLYITEMMFM